MRATLSRRAWLMAAAATTAGCGSRAEPTTGTAAANPAAETGTIPEPRRVTITATEARADAVDAAIKSYTDKVVVVDFWATWCVPCVKKFPHLVAMHRKYADRGLVCVSVSLDKLGAADEYSKDKVLAFLKGQGAAFPNFVATDPVADEKPLAATFGPDHQLLPYLVIFDKAGRRAWNSSDGPKLTDEQLDKKVEDLLSK